MKPFELRNMIDRVGQLKAEIADREAEVDKIKARLVKEKVQSAEGDLFRVAICKVERSHLDMEAVRAKLSDQFMQAHTFVSNSVVMKVSARNNEEV